MAWINSFMLFSFHDSTESLFNKMSGELNAIHENNNSRIETARQSALATKRYMGELKEYISSHHFESEAEEIYFFKIVKPRFYSRMIFFARLYQLELNRPPGNQGIDKNYLPGEFKKINRFFANNREFYHYWRSGATYLDHVYFLRRVQNKPASSDFYLFDQDDQFSTMNDYKVARMEADRMLNEYLIETLQPPENDHHPGNKRLKLRWTAQKVGLVELLYALHASATFDNSQIKALTNYFSDVFNIDLGNVYKTYEEIRLRKKNRTAFLDSLRLHLQRKMEEDD